MQRAYAVRRAALALAGGRGFASEADASPSVINVVMDLQKMHISSLDRIHAENQEFRRDMREENQAFRRDMREENQAFRQEIKGMFGKMDERLGTLGKEVLDVSKQQHKLDSFIRWSAGAVTVIGVGAGSLRLFL
jgi:FtsZ-binding cell division protein ZapB